MGWDEMHTVIYEENTKVLGNGTLFIHHELHELVVDSTFLYPILLLQIHSYTYMNNISYSWQVNYEVSLLDRKRRDVKHRLQKNDEGEPVDDV